MLLPSPASLPSPKTSALPLFPRSLSSWFFCPAALPSLCSFPLLPFQEFLSLWGGAGEDLGALGSRGAPGGVTALRPPPGAFWGTPRCPLCVPHTPNPSTSASGGPRGLQSPNWGRRGPELGEPWGGCTAPAMPRTIPPPWEAGGKTGEERERLRGGGRDPLGSLEWHQEPPGTSGTSGHLVLPGAAAELRDGAWGGSGGLLPSPRAGIREFRVGSSSPAAPRGCFSTRNVGAEALNIPRGCNPTFPARSQLSSGWAGRCSPLPAPPEGVPVWSRFFVPAPPGEGGRNERESLFAEILEVKKKRDL